MHIPPGYAMFIPSAIRKAVDLPVVGVGRFKDPLQAERALDEGHCDLVGVVRGQIADADFAAKARAGAHRRDPAVPVVQPGVRRPDGPQPLARLHREPAHRPRGRARRRASAIDAAARRCSSSAPARPACRPRSRRPAAATASPCCERDAQAGGQVRLAATRAEPGRARRHGPQPGGRVPPARRDGRARGRGRRAEVVATGGPTWWWSPPAPRPARPWWAGRRRRTSCDVRDVLDGRAPSRPARSW